MNGITAAFCGKLAKDPEPLRTVGAEGKSVLSFSLAVDETPAPETTTWCRVSVWGELAADLEPKLRKGFEVYVAGHLKLTHWEATDGTQRTGLNLSATECVVLGQMPKPPSRDSSPRSHRTETLLRNTRPRQTQAQLRDRLGVHTSSPMEE